MDAFSQIMEAAIRQGGSTGVQGGETEWVSDGFVCGVDVGGNVPSNMVTIL